jgi:hypothetical protein
MFLLLSMTFLELAAFLIIICVSINAWDKWNSKYKLAAIISLLVTGVFFINDLTIMASVNPTETTTQKIVISPKEQTLKNQLEINLYPHNNFYFTEKITLKPQSRLSIDDYRLIKNSFSKDSTMNAQLNIIPKTNNSLKYRDNQFFQNTNISQDMSLFEKNIHLNNPKKIDLENATLTLTTVKVFKTTYTNHSQGFLYTNKKIKDIRYNLDITFNVTEKPKTPTEDLETFFND